MKKLLVVLFVGFFGIGLLSGQEAGEPAKKFSIAGSGSLLPSVFNGGNAEVSILVYNSGIDIRNHFLFRGGVFSINDNDNDSEQGILMLSEKISFGGFSEQKKYRFYGFVEGGIGIFANDGKSFFEAPLIYSFGGGGGADFFFSEKLSLFFETGYLGFYLQDKVSGGSLLQIGWRGWF